MLLLAPGIEQTPQKEIDEMVEKILQTSHGGGYPPDRWNDGYGGDGPDDSGGGRWNSNRMYLIAWGMMIASWLVAGISVYNQMTAPQQADVVIPPLPTPIRAYYQNRTQSGLSSINFVSRYSAVRQSSLEPCVVPRFEAQ